MMRYLKLIVTFLLIPLSRVAVFFRRARIFASFFCLATQSGAADNRMRIYIHSKDSSKMTKKEKTIDDKDTINLRNLKGLMMKG